MARLRGVHERMVDAVLAGDGLQRVAELAAEAAGGGVAIIVPRIGGVAVVRFRVHEHEGLIPERRRRGRLIELRNRNG